MALSEPDVTLNNSSNSSLWPAHQNQNNTNVTSKFIPYSARPETYIAPVVFLIIFVVGVVGNGTLILIFLRRQVEHNGPNTYIFSLALADLMVIISTIPFTSTVYTIPSWPYGLGICKMTEFFKDVFIGVSVFTLTALSADRYFAIVDPLKNMKIGPIRSQRVNKTSLCVTVFIWVLSLTLAIPAAIFSYIKHFKTKFPFNACYPYPSHKYGQIMTVLKVLFYYLLPLLVISIFYLLMACHLLRSTKNLPGVVGHTRYRHIKRRRKAAVTILAFVLLFAICFLPQHLFFLWFYFNPNMKMDYNTFWHWLKLTGFFLAFFNSCVNPIALYFTSKTFRRYFNQYLHFFGSQKGRFKFQQSYSTPPEYSDKATHTRYDERATEAVVVYAPVLSNETVSHNGFRKYSSCCEKRELAWDLTSTNNLPIQMTIMELKGGKI